MNFFNFNAYQIVPKEEGLFSVTPSTSLFANHLCLRTPGGGRLVQELRKFLRSPQQMLTDAPQPWGLLCNPVMKIMKIMRFFLLFHFNGTPVKRKPKFSEKNLSRCHFVHDKSHTDRPRDRTRASVVRGRRLTAWAMARPSPGWAGIPARTERAYSRYKVSVYKVVN